MRRLILGESSIVRRSIRRLLTLTLILSTGCATIITGGGQDQSIRISSKVRGASVFVDDQPVGKTPVSLRVSRKDDHIVRVEQTGYAPYTKMVKSGFNGWIIGNVLFGGIIGLVVDLVSGANPSLSPTSIDAKLVADVAAPTNSYGGYSANPQPAAPSYNPAPYTPAPYTPTTPNPAPAVTTPSSGQLPPWRPYVPPPPPQSSSPPPAPTPQPGR